jgi:hypothetical protein
MQPYHHIYFHQKLYQKARDKDLRDSFVTLELTILEPIERLLF